MSRGYFSENASSANEDDSMTALIRENAENPVTREKAVMTLAAHYAVGSLSAAQASELGFFQFPQIDASLPVGEVSIVFGCVIPANAVNHVQAREFVSYLGSAEPQELKLKQIGADEGNVGHVPVHSEIEKDLLSPAAQKGEHIVRNADKISPNLMLALPESMQSSLRQALTRLFLNSGNPVQVSEFRSILEEARQRAIQNGEYTE